MLYIDELLIRVILLLKRVPNISDRNIREFLVGNKDKFEKECNYTEDFIKSLNDEIINLNLERSEFAWEENYQKVTKEIIDVIFDDIKIVHFMMEEYPKRLLSLDDFPLIIYCKGDTSLLNDQKIISFLGTEYLSNIGHKFMKRISNIFSENSYTIVSGVGIGTDSLAHDGSINNDGKSIIVLPQLSSNLLEVDNEKYLVEAVLSRGGVLVSDELKANSNIINSNKWSIFLGDGVVVSEFLYNDEIGKRIEDNITNSLPIGIFDYSEIDLETFESQKRFSGNVDGLLLDNSFSIKNKESIEAFIQEVESRKIETSRMVFTGQIKEKKNYIYDFKNMISQYIFKNIYEEREYIDKFTQYYCYVDHQLDAPKMIKKKFAPEYPTDFKLINSSINAELYMLKLFLDSNHPALYFSDGIKISLFADIFSGESGWEILDSISTYWNLPIIMSKDVKENFISSELDEVFNKGRSYNTAKSWYDIGIRGWPGI